MIACFQASLTSAVGLNRMKNEIEGSWSDETKELRDCFESIDKDGSGTIERDEIAALAADMGRPMKEWELDEAMRVMDTDGSGAVGKPLSYLSLCRRTISDSSVRIHCHRAG